MGALTRSTLGSAPRVRACSMSGKPGLPVVGAASPDLSYPQRAAGADRVAAELTFGALLAQAVFRAGESMSVGSPTKQLRQRAS